LKFKPDEDKNPESHYSDRFLEFKKSLLITLSLVKAQEQGHFIHFRFHLSPKYQMWFAKCNSATHSFHLE
jgi:hypothetical protein